MKATETAVEIGDYNYVSGDENVKGVRNEFPSSS